MITVTVGWVNPSTPDPGLELGRERKMPMMPWRPQMSPNPAELAEITKTFFMT